MRKLAAALAMASALAACSPTALRAPNSWPSTPRSFTDSHQLKAVADAFPHSAGMQRRLLGAALQAGDRDAARIAAERLAAMGAGLSVAGRSQLRDLIGEGRTAELAPLFDANVLEVSRSKVERTIAARHRLIEGVVWDPARRILYATSVVDKQLLLLRGQGGAEPLDVTDAASLFGGAYDPASKRIWLASAVIEQTAGGGFSGLIGLEPSSGKLVRVAAPDGAILGDVAVGRDGTVFASDGMNGEVYQCAPGCQALERLVPQGTFFSSQGIVPSADGKLLYVADYRYGLAAVDLASRKAFLVAADGPMMLDGIDGLDRYGNSLVAVQNGSHPIRIIRLELEADGRSIESIEVLERQSTDWGEPSLGRVIGDRFVYVANPQWERFGPGGIPKPESAAAPTQIRAISLREGR